MGSSVELHEIRAFLVLSEELHFARTAERLGLTPSRVSQTIATLELRLGAKLFDRTSRRVALTPVGTQLLQRLAPAYREMQSALDDTATQATGTGTPLRIGMYQRTVGGPHLIEIIERFSVQHPSCPVVYVDTGARNYLDILRAGEVDILATRLPVTGREFTAGPILTRERRVILVGRHQRLASLTEISHDDLADETVTDIAAYPRDMMDAFFPPVTSSGQRIKRVESPSWEQLLVAVATGRLIHPTIPSFLDYFSHPGVVAIPISDLPVTETALVWLTADRRPVIQEFAQAAQSVLTGAC